MQFDEWLQSCVEAAFKPSSTEDSAATWSSVLQDIAELGWFFSVTDVADAGEEWSSSNVVCCPFAFPVSFAAGASSSYTLTLATCCTTARAAGSRTPTGSFTWAQQCYTHLQTSSGSVQVPQKVRCGCRTGHLQHTFSCVLIACAAVVCVAGAPEVGTASATASMPAGLEVPKECFVRQSPMTLQHAAEARGVNALMREPHVATRASELLDYAGWAQPMAAADVLAGETTEKRRYVDNSKQPAPARMTQALKTALYCAVHDRFMYHLRSSADLTDKQVKQLGQPRFTASATTAVA
jgi:hypothetical protein